MEDERVRLSKKNVKKLTIKELLDVITILSNMIHHASFYSSSCVREEIRHGDAERREAIVRAASKEYSVDIAGVRYLFLAKAEVWEGNWIFYVKYYVDEQEVMATECLIMLEAAEQELNARSCREGNPNV